MTRLLCLVTTQFIIITLTSSVKCTTSSFFNKSVSFGHKSIKPAGWSNTHRCLKRSLTPEEGVTEACSKSRKSESEFDQLSKLQQPVSRDLSSEPDSGIHSAAIWGSKSSEGEQGISKSSSREEVDLKRKASKDEGRDSKTMDPDEPSAFTSEWASSRSPKVQRRFQKVQTESPSVVDTYYASCVKHLETLLHHEHIDSRSPPGEHQPVSALSELLSGLNIESIEENTPVKEPSKSQSSEVTLDEIKRLGGERWYKNQNVLNSWRELDQGAVENRLFIVLGECIQVWSSDFDHTIKIWYPEYLPIHHNVRRSEIALGTTALTRSLALKNWNMLNQATLDTSSSEQCNLARQWYRNLMGQAEFDHRIELLAEAATKAENDIIDTLVSRFTENISFQLNYIRMDREVTLAYPEIMQRAASKIQLQGHHPRTIYDIRNQLDIDKIKLSTAEDVYESLKLTLPYPTWSCRQAVHMLAMQGGPQGTFIEELRHKPFYNARFVQIERCSKRLTEDFLEVMKKITREEISLSTALELQWLHETMLPLEQELQIQIQQEAEFLFGLDSATCAGILKKAHERGKAIMTREMDEIFLSQSRLSSSDALLTLFTLERMRTCPIFWEEHSQSIRRQLRDKHRLDFDQKYEWLQERAKSAMVTLLVKSYKNLVTLVDSPLFCARFALEMHRLIQKVDSIYERNQSIHQEIWQDTYGIISGDDIINGERAMEAALRQLWTENMWDNLIESRLGYHQGDPVFKQIYSLGKSLQLKKEYPPFMDDQLQASYLNFLEISDEVQESTQHILGDEYDERADLLRILAIQEKKDHDEAFHTIVDSISSFVDSHKISEWLRKGISAPSLMLGVATLFQLQKGYDIVQITRVMDRMGLSERLYAFCNDMHDTRSLEYEETRHLFGMSFPQDETDMDMRIQIMRDYFVGNAFYFCLKTLDNVDCPRILMVLFFLLHEQISQALIDK